MADREVDVLVVGGGPAGLTAAAALAKAGVARVEVVDREARLGGIPRHSHHTGYGLRDLHRLMTGPHYAQALVERSAAAGVALRAGVTATSLDVSGPPVAIATGGSDTSAITLATTSRDGLEVITARAVVLATGARERSRAARLVPGDRPAGIYTTGQLQQAVYEYGQPVGRRAVVVGAEHVSYSAAVTLGHAGVDVVAMVTEHPRSQTYAAFRVAAAARYRFPVRTGTRLARIIGRGRVSAVELADATGGVTRLACDTVVFTGDWAPDHELARRSGVGIDGGTRGPAIDGSLRTSVPGVFAVGNLVHPVLTADLAALTARHVAGPVAAWLAIGGAARAGAGASVPDLVPVSVAGPLRWVSPSLIGADRAPPPRGCFVIWSDAVVARPRIEVRQAGRLLHAETRRRAVIPQRPYDLTAGWLAAVDLAAGPVSVSIS